MSIQGVKVVGGQMQWPRLTNKLEEKDYAIGKAICWHKMLSDLMLPTKWLKPTAKGTKVNFDQIHTQKEYDDAIAELKAHLIVMNERYGTDMQIG